MACHEACSEFCCANANLMEVTEVTGLTGSQWPKLETETDHDLIMIMTVIM